MIERWNRSFGRWVNRGARGIAVFADENRERQRLTHYFDISDTHESRYSRPVPLWNMRQEYEADVIETLESTFGEIDNKSNLAEAVICAARNAAEDNLPDYIRDLLYSVNDSFLEGLDEDSITFLYREVVTNSVAYIFKVGKDKFSKTFKFTDINYAVASREDKEAMFLEYSVSRPCSQILSLRQGIYSRQQSGDCGSCIDTAWQ